jgi:hypothetical protein
MLPPPQAWMLSAALRARGVGLLLMYGLGAGLGDARMGLGPLLPLSPVLLLPTLLLLAIGPRPCPAPALHGA